MNLLISFEGFHLKARGNRWMQLFAIFLRVALAAGFLPSGMVKILGERFTALAVNHPMGFYLEALHYTGDYYTFIGIVQVTAALLLLIPRTATLGALLYFPIILNICVLSLAVRFDGSLFTSPLMVLANLYLLCWDYHKLKWALPFYHKRANSEIPTWKVQSTSFPLAFFTGVFATVILVVLAVVTGFSIYPRNSLSHCHQQCEDNTNPEACSTFCDCIHTAGTPYTTCLDAYNNAIN
ncbi:MAG: hypothetical protein CMC08_06780 [Flavobacteriaceae bacterium]|nr:hypothetical protein [Flavobacteriaceae bacterium]